MLDHVDVWIGNTGTVYVRWQPGMRVRMGEPRTRGPAVVIEGEVVKVNPVSLWLRTADGRRVKVPHPEPHRSITFEILA